jgi:hypothetical protein
VSSAAGETIRVASKTPSRVVIISVLGVTQIFAWGPIISRRFWRSRLLRIPAGRSPGWWAASRSGC